MQNYNLPYSTPGEVLVEILYTEIRGETVDIIYEACYEELCLLDIPLLGPHFVVLYREQETNEVLDIDNPNPKEYTIGDFINAKQKGINTIYDLGFTVRAWNKEYSDFNFKNHCVM